jgi:hypothetical protein
VDHPEYIDWNSITLTLPTLDGGTIEVPVNYSGVNDAGFIMAEYNEYRGEFLVLVANPVDATSDLSYKAYVVPYSVMTVEYDVDVATMNDRTKMAEWITIDKPTGTLAPNEAAEIGFTIEVPKNAIAGGQYAAIVVGADGHEQAGGNMAITNTMEIASVIYAKVAGETIHKGEVLENNIPGFLATVPITISALMNNEGNIHEEAEISIEVSDVFTGEVIFPTEYNDGVYTEIIMPETTRFVTKEVDNLPLVGVVKVKQSIYYNYKMSVVERDVIICPTWFMALVAMTLAAVVWGVICLLLRLRRARRRRTCL